MELYTKMTNDYFITIKTKDLKEICFNNPKSKISNIPAAVQGCLW